MGNETGQDAREIHDRALHRLTICRDLTDESQADCEVIRDLDRALAAAFARAEAAEQAKRGWRHVECPQGVAYWIPGQRDDEWDELCDCTPFVLPEWALSQVDVEALTKRVRELEGVYEHINVHFKCPDLCIYTQGELSAMLDTTLAAAEQALKGGE